jgi:hypothetical protein
MTPGPDYAICFTMWDETGQRVAHSELGNQTFEILVTRVAIAWGRFAT